MAKENCRLGRCGGCAHWSSAANEARALYSMALYTDGDASYDYFLAKAKEQLSLDVLDPKKAEDRGWCKAAATLERTDAPLLAVHLDSNSVGALITSRFFGCTNYKPLPMPHTKQNPEPQPAYMTRLPNPELGPAASAEDILLSYIPHGMALDPSMRISPLHPDHPLNPRNPQNLAYNPVPAFAAYQKNGSFIEKISKKTSYAQGTADTNDGYRHWRLPRRTQNTTPARPDCGDGV